MSTELDSIVEAITFASPEGASTKEIARCITAAVASAREAAGENAPETITRYANVTTDDVVAALARLNLHYLESGRAFMLVERPAGWRIVSRPDYAPWVRELFPDKKPARLSPGAVETLAIIAYRQPVTKSSIEAVRGVSVDGPIQTLLDRNIIRIAGRADLPGRPLLYETTDLFLEKAGIRTVDELPNVVELRAVKLPEPAPAAPVTPTEESPAVPAAESATVDVSNGEPEVVAEPKPKRKGRKKKDAEPAADADAGICAEPADGDVSA